MENGPISEVARCLLFHVMVRKIDWFVHDHEADFQVRNGRHPLTG